jgi:hypothetical protein
MRFILVLIFLVLHVVSPLVGHLGVFHEEMRERERERERYRERKEEQEQEQEQEQEE